MPRGKKKLPGEYTGQFGANENFVCRCGTVLTQLCKEC